MDRRAVIISVLCCCVAGWRRTSEDAFVGKDWELKPIDLTRPQMLGLHRTGFPITVKHTGPYSTTCQCGTPERPFAGFSRQQIWLGIRFFNRTHEKLYAYSTNSKECADVSEDHSEHLDFLCYATSVWPACECLMMATEHITPDEVKTQSFFHPYAKMDWKRWRLSVRDVIPTDWLDLEDHYFQSDAVGDPLPPSNSSADSWTVITAHSVVDHGVEGHAIKKELEFQGLSYLRRVILRHLADTPRAQRFQSYPLRDEL